MAFHRNSGAYVVFLLDGLRLRCRFMALICDREKEHLHFNL